MRTMETVVDEKPLSFATSRMVTIPLLRESLNSADFAEQTDAGGHYSSRKAVSRIGALVTTVLIASLSIGANAAPQDTPRTAHAGHTPTAAEAAKTFADGEAAIGRGDLE